MSDETKNELEKILEILYAGTEPLETLFNIAEYLQKKFEGIGE